MKKNLLISVLLAIICFFPKITFAQTETNHKVLLENAKLANENYHKNLVITRQKAFMLGLPMFRYDQKGNYMWLHHFDENGHPVYYGTRSNLGSANTIRASNLWNNGGAGLNLEGQGMIVNANRSRLGMWEPGVARLTHQEFGGRVIMRDGTTFSGDNGNNKHATHVAGTMMGSGVQANAKGIAPQASLDGYDSANDVSEMGTAASEGMLTSNHSYGANMPAAGQARDIARGYYDQEAKDWDAMCFNAPFYLPVQACGNDRDDASNFSYDLLLGSSTAKNTLGVGAVNILASAYTQASDVVMSDFSSYGPTDDGRIKPDVVAAGVGIISSISLGDNQYEAQDGTSMAGPAVASALLLVQQHYKNVNSGAFLRSATLRGLAIHTAEETGTTPGPDYRFGWGLLNAERCVQVINNATQNHILRETTLANNATFTQTVNVAGGQPFRVTICWTDPAANPLSNDATAINNRTSRLVNDLDLRILDANNNVITDLPWKLDPENPTNGATKGDNTVDNVEQIYVANMPAGIYTIRVTHKGAGLTNNLQAFSMIVTGVSTNLVANPTTIANFGSVNTNANSTNSSYTLTAYHLASNASNIVVTAPANFQVAKGVAGTYSSTITYTVAELATAQTVGVRFSPTSGTAGVKSGNITHSGFANTTVAVSGTETVPTATLIVNPTSLTFGSTNNGSNSANQTYTLTATNLTTSVTVTAPTNFQVSKDGTNFSSTIAYTTTELATVQTVTARFSPASGTNGTKSGNITHSGFANTTVAVAGTEAGNLATLVANPVSLTNFGNVNNGSNSANQTYTLTATNLTTSVTVTAPTNFQVSKDGTNFSSTIAYTTTELATTQTVTARFSPTSGTNGAKSGNITHSGFANTTVAVAGTEAGNAVPANQISVKQGTTTIANNGVFAFPTGQNMVTFTIENAGTANLTIGTIVLLGTNASDFSVTQPTQTTVTGGQSTTFSVTLNNSTVAGTKSASISIPSNNATTPNYTISISGVTALPNRLTIGELKIYPNPSNGIFRIKITGEVSRTLVATLYDSKGVFVSEIKTETNQEGIADIDLSHLSAGMYQIILQVGKEKIAQKIIID